MDKLTRSFAFRHACKEFDEKKEIATKDINYILEAGRTSPSSFGLEPWHFVVIKDKKIKKALKPACYDQLQVTTCSHFIIILYRKAEQFTLQSEYLRAAMKKQLPDDVTEAALNELCQLFINYSHTLPKGTNLNHWSEMQCYIAGTNMMTAAAYIGIDSCPIGGFQHDKIEKLLTKYMPQFNPKEYGIALCLPFGYRKNPQSPQKRWPIANLTTFL